MSRIDITIQGIEGCFHEAAAKEYFGNNADIRTIPCETFQSMFELLNREKDLLGIVAIENTIAGSLLQNHELLRQSNMTIIGEQKIRISHVLAALPGQTIDDIYEVNSHPMALRQCEQFLRMYPKMKVVEHDDTAGSAKEIAENKIMGHAAVCGRYAAELYGLNILAEGIETNKRNFTRFLIIANKDNANNFNNVNSYNKNTDKASIVFTLPHTCGSLSKVLTILSFYDVNLTKIQSLPIIGREWEYCFYLDLTCDDHNRYKLALDAIKPLITEFKNLGEYNEQKFEH